jgi:thiol-disulfide isomerase/thioredoxin
MSLKESNQFELETVAPSFALPDVVSQKTVSLDDLTGAKGTVIMFICNHCPYVIHVNKQLVQLANDYLPKGINFLAISSNDAKRYPQDGPAMMEKAAVQLKYPFPYLYDESQEVAMAYAAACTPDFYIFDQHNKAVYHGQLDSSRPGNRIPVTGEDMRTALDNMLDGLPPLEIQKPSSGCSIKWK